MKMSLVWALIGLSLAVWNLATNDFDGSIIQLIGITIVSCNLSMIHEAIRGNGR